MLVKLKRVLYGTLCHKVQFHIVLVHIRDPLYRVQLTLNTTSFVRVNTHLLMVWSMIQRIGNTVMDTTGDFTLKCAMD